MKLRLQFRRYRASFRTAVRTAHGMWAEREGLLVRLENEAGAVGYGEAAPIPWFGTETVEEAEAGARVLGEWTTAEQIAAVPARLGCLKNALAAAVSEVGRVCDPPSDAASAKGRVTDPPYLGVAALLPAGRAALAQIEPRAELGFRVFKWKVGVGDAADELGLLDDVCAALPSGAKLRLDANGAWDRRTAERWLERCAERPVEFVEQPSFADAAQSDAARRKADDCLLGLAGDFPTPIALDESVVGAGDIARWIGAGWPGVFVIKPSLIAEVGAAIAALEKAKARVVFSSALETAVGARTALRVAFAWKGEPRALGFGVWPLFADARFDGPMAMPFLRAEDVARLNPEAVWTALS
ncbi:MAG: o-succinylbenzoate synthase [Opitutaceae bacterium]|nr:o-succinylbenzoate synthase [Opitutaceae bacterium]